MNVILSEVQFKLCEQTLSVYVMDAYDRAFAVIAMQAAIAFRKEVQ